VRATAAINATIKRPFTASLHIHFVDVEKATHDAAAVIRVIQRVRVTLVHATVRDPALGARGVLTARAILVGIVDVLKFSHLHTSVATYTTVETISVIASASSHQKRHQKPLITSHHPHQRWASDSSHRSRVA
jgi:hypothetical protein